MGDEEMAYETPDIPKLSEVLSILESKGAETPDDVPGDADVGMVYAQVLQRYMETEERWADEEPKEKSMRHPLNQVGQQDIR